MASVSIDASAQDCLIRLFEVGETAAGAFVLASSNGTFLPGALFGRLRATH
jgi:hypothetical protein